MVIYFGQLYPGYNNNGFPVWKMDWPLGTIWQGILDDIENERRLGTWPVKRQPTTNSQN